MRFVLSFMLYRAIASLCPHNTALLLNGLLRVRDIETIKGIVEQLQGSCLYIATYEKCRNVAEHFRRLHNNTKILYVPYMTVHRQKKNSLPMEFVSQEDISSILKQSGDFSQSYMNTNITVTKYPNMKSGHQLSAINQWSSLHVLISKFSDELSTKLKIIKSRSDVIVREKRTSSTPVYFKDFPVQKGVIYADSDRVFSATGSDFVRVFKDFFTVALDIYWKRPISVKEKVVNKVILSSYLNNTVYPNYNHLGCHPRGGQDPREPFGWARYPDYENNFAYHVLTNHLFKCSNFKDYEISLHVDRQSFFCSLLE